MQKQTIKKDIALQAPLILVVEDNPITRKSVRVALHAEGYRVVEAEDGASAVEKMKAEAPDLALLDLLLPDIHGADLIVQLRALRGGADIPILAFSGFVSKTEEARVAGAGFTDFLLKPIEPSRLVSTVANFLAHRSATVATVGAGRRLLLADDDPVQLKLSRLQFERAGFKVHIAHDGAEALAEAKRKPPDVIVTDVLMPHLDGFDLCLAVRADPRLQNIPLVMVSANYLEDQDQQIGVRVGASAFLYREMGFEAILRATEASMTRAAPAATATAHELETERHAQIVRQLERQVHLHAACAQRNVVQSAILHELGLIADTLAKRKDLESALDQILAYCLDGAGLSKGVLYLNEPGASLVLRAQYGCSAVVDSARAFFGTPEIFQRALRTGEALMLPSIDLPATQTEVLLHAAQAKSGLVIPVRSGDEDIAVLLLLSLHRDLLEEDWVAFGRAMAGQIGQSVALSRTFYRLAESERRYRSLFEAANDGICVTDDHGDIVDANPAACVLAGYPLERLRGMNIGEILAGLDHDHWPTILHEYERTGALNGEFTYVTRAGTEKTVEVHGSRVMPGMFINIMLDVTERRRAEQTIQRLAYRDILTDLPNRTALQQRLRAGLTEAKVQQRTLALLLLNLDNFRDVNDALGHPAGDQVLAQVAARMRNILWGSDMVARLAADEFAVLLPRLAERRHIDLVVRKLVEGFKSPFVVAGVPLDIQPSIGVALYPEHGTDADALFQHADVALHFAKAQHQCYALYDADIDHYDPQQIRLMAELRSAIAENALTLYYQPKVQLAGNTMHGVEALVRWRHPRRGLVPPAEFIPIAEKTSLIDDLTRWVVAAALRQAGQWRAAGMPLRIAVNISARNLQDRNFVQQMMEVLTQMEFEPDQLVFELTESAIMLDPTGAKRKLIELHQRGVRFAIDDFGTGYSSLSYLRELPVSQLKIDRSFVAHIAEASSAAIIKGTIDLAHNLGLRVVAEGVEDQATADALRDMGCDVGQGYYFGRPMPPEELQEWWHQRVR